MKILIACEFSGVVREAFAAKGHDAWSCDIEQSEITGQHIQDDVLNHLNDGWGIMIAHPPCTYLTSAGNRWFNEERYGEKAAKRKKLREDSVNFVAKLWESRIDKVCIENPVGYLNTSWRKPTQIIRPYEFGEPDSKKTCLWLRGLPKLLSTELVKPKIYSYYKTGKNAGKPIYRTEYLSKSKDRVRDRSRTYKKIAQAMADQWG